MAMCFVIGSGTANTKAFGDDLIGYGKNIGWDGGESSARRCPDEWMSVRRSFLYDYERNSHYYVIRTFDEFSLSHARTRESLRHAQAKIPHGVPSE